jgi:arginase family enzyme
VVNRRARPPSRKTKSARASSATTPRPEGEATSKPARVRTAVPDSTVAPPSRPSLSRFRPPAPDVAASAGVPSLLRLPLFLDRKSTPPVDVLLCGVPFESRSFRPGTGFGARALRDASAWSRPFSGALGVDVFGEIAVADGGDVNIASDSADAALEAVAAHAEAMARSGVIPGFAGGDQVVTLGALTGLRRAKHRALGLLHFGAHPGASAGQTLDASRFVRVAVSEGLVRADSTLQVGLRGPYASADERSFGFSRGIDTAGVDDVRWDLHAAVGQVRRLVRKGAVYVTVDIGVLDPAFAPGASYPVPGGLSSWELQQLLRALVGAEIAGFDVVGISPSFDSSGITALAGVMVLQEILATVADTRRSAGPAPSTRRSGRPGRRSA